MRSARLNAALVSLGAGEVLAEFLVGRREFRQIMARGGLMRHFFAKTSLAMSSAVTALGQPA